MITTYGVRQNAHSGRVTVIRQVGDSATWIPYMYLDDFRDRVGDMQSDPVPVFITPSQTSPSRT